MVCGWIRKQPHPRSSSNNSKTRRRLEKLSILMNSFDEHFVMNYFDPIISQVNINKVMTMTPFNNHREIFEKIPFPRYEGNKLFSRAHRASSFISFHNFKIHHDGCARKRGIRAHETRKWRETFFCVNPCVHSEKRIDNPTTTTTKYSL
jgi:hypothetical protein